MNAATVITIRPDDEYNADEFWSELRREFPTVAELLRENNFAHVTPEHWEQIQRLPGFTDGPQHAPTALIVDDHDRDEDDCIVD